MVTYLVDEYHQLHKDVRPHMDTIFKSGDERECYIPRCNKEDPRKIDFFDAFGFMAIASRKPVHEDMENRSLVIAMRERQREIKKTLDKEGMRELRGELLRWRIEVLSGGIELPKPTWDNPIHDEDMETVSDELGDRSRSIAEALLASGQVFGDGVDTLLAVAKCDARAREEVKSNIEGEVATALVSVYNECVKDARSTTLEGKKRNVGLGMIKVKDITRVLEHRAEDEGMDLKKYNPYTPQRIGKNLKVLTIDRKHTKHGSVVWDKDLETKIGFLIAKYGDECLVTSG